MGSLLINKADRAAVSVNISFQMIFVELMLIIWDRLFTDFSHDYLHPILYKPMGNLIEIQYTFKSWQWVL